MFDSKTIQDVEKFWNKNPCNIRHSHAPEDTREFSVEVTTRKHRVEPHIPGFADFSAWDGKRVLELGCGIGTAAIEFALAGAMVTAVDLTSRSLEIARKRAWSMGVFNRITFIQADLEHLSDVVPIEEYDLVYSFGVIHHTPHPERAVAEAKKYLGLNSELRIMVYNRYSWKVGAILLSTMGEYEDVDQAVAQYSEAQEGCPVTYTYSKGSARKLLNGLEITSMSVEHIFPYEISLYREYRYRKVWYFRWMPKVLFRWLEHHFGWHLCVTARLPR